jgi:hypothetical protein
LSTDANCFKYDIIYLIALIIYVYIYQDLLGRVKGCGGGWGGWTGWGVWDGMWCVGGKSVEYFCSQKLILYKKYKNNFFF